MAWHARLHLHYTRRGERTVAFDRHEGPLRVLQPLYPEGSAVCHHVLVHPPGGLVGGDRLHVDLRLEAGCHALVTTPGAARLYRSTGETVEQRVQARLEAGSRLEWLPLETLAYSGCLARNRLHFDLAPGAELIAWDVLAFGLPAAGKPFERGSVLQEIELRDTWLERGRVEATDHRLLDSPLGLAGRRVMATLCFAAGSGVAAARREALLESARAIAAADPWLAGQTGVTAPNDSVVVLRALADRVEPAMQMLGRVRACWRSTAWSLEATTPRVWRT